MMWLVIAIIGAVVGCAIAYKRRRGRATAFSRFFDQRSHTRSRAKPIVTVMPTAQAGAGNYMAPLPTPMLMAPMTTSKTTSPLVGGDIALATLTPDALGAHSAL